MLTQNLLIKSGLIKEIYTKSHCSNILDDFGLAFVTNNRMVPFNIYTYNLNCLKKHIILGTVICDSYTENIKSKMLVHDNRFIIEDHFV